MVQQLIGGANIARQKQALKKRKPLIIVGTPGRLNEMLRGHLGLHYVETVALDEADRLHQEGLLEDTGNLLSHAGRKTDDGPQYLLTSASLTPETLDEMCENWGLPEMCEIYAKAKTGGPDEQKPGALGASISPSIRHWMVPVFKPNHRVDDLRKVINALGVPKVLVFMNYARRLKDTLFRLQAGKVGVAILHSDMPKQARQNTIRAFERGSIRALIVSEIISSGLVVR